MTRLAEAFALHRFTAGDWLRVLLAVWGTYQICALIRDLRRGR